MELTREEAIRNFREHWASLAITGMSDKADYLRRNGYPKIAFNCFLCEFTNSTCFKCPIEWPQIHPAKKYSSFCTQSYYGEWEDADTPEERKRIAAIIRDLPEKNEAKPALKIGDRVTALSIERKISGKTGTVKGFAADGDVGVEFDEHVGGHELQVYLVKGTEGKDGHCWWVKPQLLEKLEKSAPRFAVGDKVVPISKTVPGWEDEAPNWNNRGGKEQGFLYVRHINSELTREHKATVYICGAPKADSGGDYYLESDLIPYVEPPKFKFAVGDKVRAIAETNGWGKVKKGDIGTITHTPDTHPCKDNEHYKDRYRVDFPAQKEWDGKEECFELVTDEPKEEAKTTFSVGDRVRNIKEYDYHPKAVGKIGTVIWVTDSDYIAVEFDEHVDGHNALGKGKKGYCWCFDPEYLELVKDEPKQEPRVFKVGDRVRVKSNSRVGEIKGIAGKFSLIIGVEFSEPTKHGHDFNGFLPKGKDGHCYFYAEDELEPFPINHCPENKIIKDGLTTFIFNGPVTTCIIEFADTKFKGTAKCNPSDKWDEKTGKILAMARALRPLLDAIEKGLRQC